MESKDTPMEVLVSRIHSFYSAYQEANDPPFLAHGSSTDLRWKPPDEGIVKLNFDGATLSDPVGTGGGVVARDSLGRVLGWRRSFLAFGAQVEVSEVIAWREALRMIRPRTSISQECRKDFVVGAFGRAWRGGRERDREREPKNQRDDCERREDGKTSWPELVGANGEKAATVVEKENRNVNAIVLKDGTPVTRDFRCDRVWVWVNDYGVVVRAPRVG
ncbi:hypothetical protein BUALT_Bualt02G0208500 [Buddleja alternifolia]|uniref:Uncharacterized protein n=1 Tax=Buddleja alternifolia TaxID=168488 RepID=A0AAV6Y9X9_9LAMI|nr:hypothetical protein BUALT_Bualt02G0208500 [Buddleja alternifolia]